MPNCTSKAHFGPMAGVVELRIHGHRKAVLCRPCALGVAEDLKSCVAGQLGHGGAGEVKVELLKENLWEK